MNTPQAPRSAVCTPQKEKLKDCESLSSTCQKMEKRGLPGLLHQVPQTGWLETAGVISPFWRLEV